MSATKSTPKTDQAPNFEDSLKALEALVERLEKGDLPLEEALKQFERGVALTRSCQAALKQAEQKVEILLKPAANPDDRAVLDTFDPES